MKTALILATLAGLTSCSSLQSALTGQPIPTTAVSREGGPAVNVATTDLIQAESAEPTTVWGLYNAGKLAEHIAEAVNVSATK